MAHPDPKSFDTLEKAQAEIARLYDEKTRIANRLDQLASFAGEINKARANIAKLLSKEGAQ